jgi:type II secretion system protein N
MVKKILLILLFLAYAVALTLVLLVVRFPKEELLAAAAARVETLLPAADCTIADIDYHHPLGLVFSGISIDDAVMGSLAIDEAEVRFDTKRPLTRFSIRLNVLGAEVTGEMLLDRTQATVTLPGFSVRGLDMAAASLGQRLARELAGVVNFSGTYQAPLAKPLAGALNGRVQVEDLQLSLKRPILQETMMRFDTASVDIDITDGAIALSQGEAAGPDYEGSFTGLVRFSGTWWDSELAVAGELLPRPQYLADNRQAARAVALLNRTYGPGPLPFHISGSLLEPAFQFGQVRRP